MTKTFIVSSTHFLFWECNCGHFYGRHSGVLSQWPNAGKCFDCKCPRFRPKKPFEEWQKEKRALAEA